MRKSEITVDANEGMEWTSPLPSTCKCKIFPQDFVKRISQKTDEDLQLRILRNVHDSPAAGHLGRDRTLALMRR